MTNFEPLDSIETERPKQLGFFIVMNAKLLASLVDEAEQFDMSLDSYIESCLKDRHNKT